MAPLFQLIVIYSREVFNLVFFFPCTGINSLEPAPHLLMKITHIPDPTPEY